MLTYADVCSKGQVYVLLREACLQVTLFISVVVKAVVKAVVKKNAGYRSLTFCVRLAFR